MAEGALEMAKNFFSLPIETKMEVGQSFVTSITHPFQPTMQIENRKTPPFNGYSPLFNGNNKPEDAGDLQEAFELGWESPNKDNLNDIDESSVVPVMAGANIWPPEEHVPGFRQTVLDYQ